jgi:hypothetical protein
MVYLKHGCYYGRWYTAAGGRANRKLGPARKPGTAVGLTQAQAEKRLVDQPVEIELESQLRPRLSVGVE